MELIGVTGFAVPAAGLIGCSAQRESNQPVSPSLMASIRRFGQLSFFASIMAGVLVLSAECQEQKKYPVTLDGHTVIEIGYGYRALPPEQRSQLISEKLRKVADDPSVPASIRLEPADASIIDLMAGENHLVSVLPGDVINAGVPAESLAHQWASALEAAIQQYRHQHSWSKLIQRLFLSLLTLSAAIFLLFAIRNVTTRLAALTAAHIEQRIEGTHRRMFSFIPRNHVRRCVVSLFKVFRFVLSIGLIFLAFQLLLLFFPGTRSLASNLLNSLFASVGAFAASAWNHAPAIAFLAVVAIATRYLLKAVRFFFRRVGDGSISIEGFRPTWASTTHKLASILLIVLAVLVAYPYIPGAESPAFKGVSIFLGLLVSLGSTGLVANIVSGIMLTYMDEFRVGDLIQVGDFTARVRRTSMLTTELHTRKNEIVTIPNSLILSREVTNLSSCGDAGPVINSTVGTGYDVPWRQVENMMKLAASRTSGVSPTPEPFVYTMSLNQFDITHELNVHLEKDAPYWATRSELNRKVLDAFNEQGVQIMTPAYEGDPEASKIVPKGGWFVTPAGANAPDGNKSRGESFKNAG